MVIFESQQCFWKVTWKVCTRGPWCLWLIKAETFVAQCEFSGLWQKVVLIQLQACVLSAAFGQLYTPLSHLLILILALPQRSVITR